MKLVQGLFFVLCFIANLIYGQTPNFQWVYVIQGAGFEEVTNLVIDNQGNIYSTGWFNGTLLYTLNGVEDSLINQGGDADMFIEKRTSNGDLVWIKYIGGEGTVSGSAITINDFGHIAILGGFDQSIDVNPGAAVDSLYLSDGDFNQFILKLDTENGDFIWAKHIYGHAPNLSVRNSLKFDTSGKLYHTGLFIGDFDLNPSSTEEFILTANNGRHVFVQKLDSEGDFIWGKQVELEESLYNNDITATIDVTSENDVVIAGCFQDTIDLDLGPGTEFVYSPDKMSVYIIKLDSLGNSLWTSSLLGHGGYFRCPNVKVDYNNNILLQGYYQDTIDFNPGWGVEEMYPLYDGNAVYILKLDPNGEYIWSKSINTVATFEKMGLDVDQFGNIYTTNSYFFSALVPTVSGINTHISEGLTDVLMTQLNADGQFLWSGSFGGQSSDMVNNLKVDKYGENIYTVGHFYGTTDFNPNTDVYNLESTHVSAGFIQKLNTCRSVFIDEYIQCEPLTWINGETYYSSTNLEITDTLVNSNGCDSIVYLDFTVPQVDTNISLIGTSLVSNQSGATYQWLDCNQGMEEIPGETSINYSPQISGSYAVEITYGNCIAISECFEIQTVSVPEGMVKKLNLYSNPSEDNVTIDFGKMPEQASIRVYNLLGQDIVQAVCSGEESKQLFIPEAKGVYFIDVEIGGSNQQFKILKY